MGMAVAKTLAQPDCPTFVLLLISVYFCKMSIYTFLNLPYTQYFIYIMYEKFTFKKVYVLPTECTYMFTWLSKETAIISLLNINWLVFIVGIPVPPESSHI